MTDEGGLGGGKHPEWGHTRTTTDMELKVKEDLSKLIHPALEGSVSRPVFSAQQKYMDSVKTLLELKNNQIKLHRHSCLSLVPSVPVIQMGASKMSFLKLYSQDEVL